MLGRIGPLFVLALAGCQSYYFTDTVDLELDFDFTPEDEVHSPYVIGAEFSVRAHAVRGEDFTGWQIRSSDPGVLAVTMRSGEPGFADVATMSEGEATIELYDADGNLVHAEDVEVRAPAAADLLWHGSLLLDYPEEDAVVGDANILVGGTGTFLVRWRDEQGRRLNGNGTLHATSEGLGVNIAQSYLFEDRDWLQLTALEEGTFTVEVGAGDLPPIASFTVTAVADIEGIVLEGEPEAGAETGQWLVVVATGVGADGQPIYGVEYTWDVEGEALLETGDLLRYEYDPNIPVMVGASYGDQYAQTMIRASTFDVDSTNDIGCSAAGASAVPMASLPLLIAIGLIWRARKRPITRDRAA